MAVLVVVPSVAVRKYVQPQLPPGASVAGTLWHCPAGRPSLSRSRTPVRVALPVFRSSTWYQTVSPSVTEAMLANDPVEVVATLFARDSAKRGATEVVVR